MYEEGGTNIWKALAVKGSLYLIAGLVGGYFFLSYFFTGVSGKEETMPTKISADAMQVFDAAGTYLGVENASGKVDPPKPVKVDEYADLTGDQRYVSQLKDLGRVRLAARAEVGGRIRGWVEWVNTSGETVEQMEVAAVEALGYTATWASFGVKLVAGDHTIIATPWPREIRVRDPDQRLYNLSPSTARQGSTIGYTPGNRPDVFPRRPGYQPSTTYTGPVSSL